MGGWVRLYLQLRPNWMLCICNCICICIVSVPVSVSTFGRATSNPGIQGNYYKGQVGTPKCKHCLGNLCMYVLMYTYIYIYINIIRRILILYTSLLMISCKPARSQQQIDHCFPPRAGPTGLTPWCGPMALGILLTQGCTAAKFSCSLEDCLEPCKFAQNHNCG